MQISTLFFVFMRLDKPITRCTVRTNQQTHSNQFSSDFLCVWLVELYYWKKKKNIQIAQHLAAITVNSHIVIGHHRGGVFGFMVVFSGDVTLTFNTLWKCSYIVLMRILSELDCTHLSALLVNLWKKKIVRSMIGLVECLVCSRECDICFLLSECIGWLFAEIKWYRRWNPAHFSLDLYYLPT